jgi:hypothetical protein
MIAGNKERIAFRDYSTILSDLEEAFRFAGENVEFCLGLRGGKDRYVQIYYNGKPGNIKFIEGDSPAQAIKDVAAAVKL